METQSAIEELILTTISEDLQKYPLGIRNFKLKFEDILVKNEYFSMETNQKSPGNVCESSEQRYNAKQRGTSHPARPDGSKLGFQDLGSEINMS